MISTNQVKDGHSLRNMHKSHVIRFLDGEGEWIVSTTMYVVSAGTPVTQKSLGVRCKIWLMQLASSGLTQQMWNEWYRKIKWVTISESNNRRLVIIASFTMFCSTRKRCQVCTKPTHCRCERTSSGCLWNSIMILWRCKIWFSKTHFNGDECWVQYFQLETKQTSKEWWHFSSSKAVSFVQLGKLQNCFSRSSRIMKAQSRNIMRQLGGRCALIILRSRKFPNSCQKKQIRNCTEQAEFKKKYTIGWDEISCR